MEQGRVPTFYFNLSGCQSGVTVVRQARYNGKETLLTENLGSSPFCDAETVEAGAETAVHF